MSYFVLGDTDQARREIGDAVMRLLDRGVPPTRISERMVARNLYVSQPTLHRALQRCGLDLSQVTLVLTRVAE